MPPRNHQETIRFNLDIPAQARALQIYQELLAQSPDCKSLGTLFPKVLTVLAEVAKEHPALCDRTAFLFAKHQAKILAYMEALESGQAPEIPEAAPRPAAAIASSNPASTGDIEIDYSALQ